MTGGTPQDAGGRNSGALLTGLKPDCCNIGFNDGLAPGRPWHTRMYTSSPAGMACYRSRGGIRWVIADNAAYRKK